MAAAIFRDEEEKLPPGFRFHPTDEELVAYYLKKKISEADFVARAIADVDLNKCEPWDLPGKAKMGEKEWYFFSLRDRKYPTGVRTNRGTSAGYWKTTGKDKEIFDSTSTELVVGMKKTLVFYKGRAPRGEKTNWIMHEYRLHSNPSSKVNKDEWVVCRIFAKSPCSGKKYPSNQPRAVSHYTIGTGNAMVPSLLHSDPFCSLGISSNHHLTSTEFADLARFAKDHPCFDLPIQPQLNLNRGVQPQNVTRRMPFPLPQQPAAVEQDLSPWANCIVSAADEGLNVGCDSPYLDNCMDLESYWPNY